VRYLRVASLHEAALHREDRAHDPLGEWAIVDTPGIADGDVLGDAAGEPVDPGAQRLDDPHPSRRPREGLEERGPDAPQRHDQVDLGEIRERRRLGRDEPDIHVRRHLTHVRQLVHVRQAHDDGAGRDRRRRFGPCR
jgi:hypothetical protein